MELFPFLQFDGVAFGVCGVANSYARAGAGCHRHHIANGVTAVCQQLGSCIIHIVYGKGNMSKPLTVNRFCVRAQNVVEAEYLQRWPLNTKITPTRQTQMRAKLVRIRNARQAIQVCAAVIAFSTANVGSRGPS